jgi:hypothetical protein
MLEEQLRMEQTQLLHEDLGYGQTTAILLRRHAFLKSAKKHKQDKSHRFFSTPTFQLDGNQMGGKPTVWVWHANNLGLLAEFQGFIRPLRRMSLQKHAGTQWFRGLPGQNDGGQM